MAGGSLLTSKIALKPGRYFPGSPIRLTATFADTDGTLVDPTTIMFKTQDPLGNNATYTYGSDTIMGRAGTGSYFVDFTPDQGGRWFVRWETTGTSTTFAIEDSILIQRSPFLDGRELDAYRRPW